MRFKSIIATLALAGVSSFVQAAGSYDGVYQAAGVTGYVVIMQNGTTLGAAVMGTANNAASVRWGAANTGYVVPSTINVWNVATGTISGNTATVTGQTDYGACNTTARLTFDGAGNLTMVGVSSTATQFGLASGYSCAQNATATTALTRVF